MPRVHSGGPGQGFIIRSSYEFDNFVEFKKKYNELITLVYKSSGEEKLNVFIKNVSDEDLKLLINNFCNSIESDKKIRKLFFKWSNKYGGTIFPRLAVLCCNFISHLHILL